MRYLNPKTVIASGKEMAEADLAVKNTDDTIMMWILWNWNVSTKSEQFAPVVDVSFEKINTSTHKVTGEEIYFELPKASKGYAFSDFINKHIQIEEL